MRKNQLTPETEEEINEIVTKNFLQSKKITYTKITDYVGKVQGTQDEEEQKQSVGKGAGKAPAGATQASATGGFNGNGKEGEGAGDATSQASVKKDN